MGFNLRVERPLAPMSACKSRVKLSDTSLALRGDEREIPFSFLWGMSRQNRGLRCFAVGCFIWMIALLFLSGCALDRPSSPSTYLHAQAYKSDVDDGGVKKTRPADGKAVNPFEAFLKARQEKARKEDKAQKDSANPSNPLQPADNLPLNSKGSHAGETLFNGNAVQRGALANGGDLPTESPTPVDEGESTASITDTPITDGDEGLDTPRKRVTLMGGDNPEKKRPLGLEEKVSVELAFDNADLFEVLDATLFELFQINYIIDPHIRAKLSFHFSGEYTQKEFIELLNEILQLSDLSITGGPGEIYKVVRKSEGASLTSDPIYRERLPKNSGDISRLIKLKYVDAASASKSIRTFASKGAPISVDTVNNTLILTDTRENVEKIIRIIAMMDLPYFMDIAWRIFPVHEAEAKDLVSDITKVVRSSGLYYRPGAVKGGYQILTIDSMNAILVVTRWPEMLDLVDKWVTAMDHMGGDAGGGTGVFVYFVENGTAVELADILNQLYGGKKKESSKKTQIVAAVENSSTSGKKNGKTSTPPSPFGASGESGSGDLIGEVEIIPDETNNAIVFKASQRDYKVIKSVLKELDVVPRQVLINVVVAEVTLSDNLRYGVQWLMNNNFGDYEAQGSWDGTDSSSTSRSFNQALGNKSNFTYGIYNSADALKALVSALDEDSSLNILSSPNIMAVDNKEAYIEVGEDVPTVTGTVTDTSSGNVTSTVQYQKTGIILTVTPHINSSGLVKMELSQEVSDVGSKAGAGGNYSINTRKAETSLVVNDGQTILLGGLMKRKSDESDAGVPFLKDIPILGYLFKTAVNETTKTELIFLLTPHVVDSRDDADRVTREFAGKIESIKDLIGTEH